MKLKLFKTEPYRHQLRAYFRFRNFSYSGNNILALLTDMGTGKSNIAIDIAAYKYTGVSQAGTCHAEYADCYRTYLPAS